MLNSRNFLQIYLNLALLIGIIGLAVGIFAAYQIQSFGAAVICFAILLAFVSVFFVLRRIAAPFKLPDNEQEIVGEVLEINDEELGRPLGEGIMHQVWTALPDGKLDYVNCRTLEYFGVSKEQILKDGWQDFVHPDDLPGCVEKWTNTLATGANYEVEFRLKRADGEYFWHLGRATAGRDGENKIFKWFGTNSDIHNQKSAEEAWQKSEAKFRSIIETTKDWIWEVDRDGNAVYNNPAVKKIIGYAPEELAGKNFLRQIHHDDRAKIESLFLQFIEEKRGWTNFVIRWQHKNGETRHLESSAVPIFENGEVTGFRGANHDITRRKKTEENLQESELRYRRLFENNPNPIWVYDAETLKFLTVNEEAVRHYGYSREEYAQLNVRDLRPPEDVPLLEKYILQAVDGKEIFRSVRHTKKDGSIIEVDIASQEVCFDGRRARFLLITDVTESKRAERALQESEEKWRTLLTSMSEGLLQVDKDDSIVFVNQCFCEMVGYEQEELIGKNWSRLLLDDASGEFVEEINQRRRKGIADRYELSLQKKSGETIYAMVGGVPVLGAEGTVSGSMGVFTDITERKRIEEQLQYDAFHDGLTGLANRALFMDHLRMILKRAKNRSINPYAVLFLDFDRFKIINDSLGHAEGDKLLNTIARRLESSVRTGDLVARLGGDEFVILLSEMLNTNEALLVAERIQNDLRAAFDVSGREIFISASIGITLSTAGHTKAEDMLRDADIAMYRAKANGKAQYQVFDKEMHEQASKQLQLETEMRHALKRREFLLHYQPIINLENGALVGFEALVRWKHRTRGLIPPLEFIPAAEENNLILPLGKWILQESCRQLRQWQIVHPAASDLTISVNLSCKEFLQFDLAGQIAATLAATKLDPHCLKLEITESHVMENREMAVTMINRLRSLGVQLSLDDFGTGYSSLSYLHRLPVNFLKIDRSFVTQMAESRENEEIVHTIIKLAQNLKMKTVAEGIETAEQFEQLKHLKCEYGQGYFFSKPLEAEKAESFIGQTSKNIVLSSDSPVINLDMNM